MSRHPVTTPCWQTPFRQEGAPAPLPVALAAHIMAEPGNRCGGDMKPAVIVRCFTVVLVCTVVLWGAACRQSPDAKHPAPDLFDVADLEGGRIAEIVADRGAEEGISANDLKPPPLDVDLRIEDETGVQGLCGNGLLPPGGAVDGGVVSLSCDIFKVFVQPVAPGILRLNYQVGGPQPALPYAIKGFVPDPQELSWGSDGERLEVCTTDLHVTIDLTNCALEVADAGGFLLLRDSSDKAVSQEAMTFRGATYDARTLVRESPVDEVFFGLGEKTGGLNKRGGKYLFWNSDTPGYPTDHDPLYQSVPFYVGLKGGRAYGLFLNNTWRSTFDMAASAANEVRITALQGDLDQYVMAGPKIDALSANKE